MNNCLRPIVDSNYVLTLDYALKILNIHERYECGIPVIIEGETGGGKTALIEMLSKLWNASWLRRWTLEKERIIDLISRQVQLVTGKINYHKCLIIKLSADD